MPFLLVRIDLTDTLAGLGPGIGAVAAVLFYKFIKVLEYEVANPGQDEASEEDADAAATPKKEVV